MRIFKARCPDCGAPAVIRKTDWKTLELADLYCACSDVECGHTFVCTMTFSHTLSPGARSCRNMVKFLVDAMRPEDRRYALELLSRRS
ncbi:ogr/Delta-like zinc finger family protein [Escherichia coli]|uniref:ogr/Delta-like zinc finger family protein n=1 Tax=Escherichia coli TaxID=562 RepID=UPI00044C7BB9|nr:ogr/Delta-like zinc finger family protein [Escherichia coli]EER0914968.1 ogr/Delta-like zinc finger family protein [Escherichia coli O168:H8]EES8553325.1 ogr/Delta-like zinc finger family protein [Escherichia coli O168]EHY1577193.1 ogr/Delta-like zinc finger family protein [Escherichia coli O8]EEQ1649938.1 ogr/Delta-like zinc finger family protein [Escherichia coli]EEQ8765023.1 ogr/Delta-like zinc finger family protein [Escherichia coli]